MLLSYHIVTRSQNPIDCNLKKLVSSETLKELSPSRHMT